VNSGASAAAAAQLTKSPPWRPIGGQYPGELPMPGRLLSKVRLAIAALVAASPALAAPPLPQPRIVAVGDLHGDFSVWRDIALAAGIEAPDGRWTGGRTILVQVGDVVDREPGSLRIIRDLMRLQKEAPKQGGKVIALVGNHEAMNVTGDLRYTVPADFAAYATPNSAALRERLYQARKVEVEAKYRAKDPAISSRAIHDAWIGATPLGWVEQRLAWASNGEVGRWVDRNPAVALVEGNLFVHGGLSVEYSKLSLDDINRKVDAALRSIDRSPGSILTDPLGPLWYRGLITRDPKVTEIAAAGSVRPSIDQELATVLKTYGAKRIVVGHTPNLKGIQILGGGKLVTIDTGNSRYYGGPPSYLEIIGEKVVPHTVKRSGTAGGGGE
jgi:hypothetical protein